MNQTEVSDVRARKPHQCTWCGESILAGEMYKAWVSFDDSVYRNKMHPECFGAMQADLDADDEYFPYDNERPGPGYPMSLAIGILQYESSVATAQLEITERANNPWKAQKIADLKEKIFELDVAIKRLREPQ